MSAKQGIPRGAIRINVGIQLVAMFVLLVAANYFSFNHYKRVDLSRSQKFVLSEQTRRALKELKTPVRVTVFFSPTSNSPEKVLYGDVRSLLKELIFSGREKIEVEYVDPTRDLSRARELQGKYKFNADENVIILDYEGRTKLLPAADMGDFDMTPMMSGDPPKLLSFKGEQSIANGLIALTNPETKKVYFLQGHSEPPLSDNTPISAFLKYLKGQNVAVAPLSLASNDSVPADCAMLVIIGAQSDLSAREAAVVDQYWAGQQGRLLILLDPDAQTPNLNGIAERAGIVPVDDRVLRIVRLPFATGILRDVTGDYMEGNAVTKRLFGYDILFTGATQSLNADKQTASTAGTQLWPLISAKEVFWGEMDYVTDEKKGVKYDDGRDIGFPVYLAMAASRSGVADDRVEVEGAKLVVVGNCQFALDVAATQKGQTNLDFLSSASNWLLDRNKLTGIVAKNVQAFTLKLTDTQLSQVVLYTMIVMPGVVALFAIVAWLRRRA